MSSQAERPRSFPSCPCCCCSTDTRYLDLSFYTQETFYLSPAEVAKSNSIRAKEREKEEEKKDSRAHRMLSSFLSLSSTRFRDPPRTVFLQRYTERFGGHARSAPDVERSVEELKEGEEREGGSRRLRSTKKRRAQRFLPSLNPSRPRRKFLTFRTLLSALTLLEPSTSRGELPASGRPPRPTALLLDSSFTLPPSLPRPPSSFN